MMRGSYSRLHGCVARAAPSRDRTRFGRAACAQVIDLGPEGARAVVVLWRQELQNRLRSARSLTQASAHADPLSQADSSRLAGVGDAKKSCRYITHLCVEGACQHNLKNVSAKLPREKMTVFCGPSGSGKSSLALDTIYAEGQRRYVESLSSYARQFLGQVQKPKVEHITGLSPAISIEQNTTSKSPRSTVGTVTEVYDYLRILYARLGQRHCPNCGRPVGTQTADEIVDKVLSLPKGRSLQMAPLERKVEKYDTGVRKDPPAGFTPHARRWKSYTIDAPPEIDHRAALSGR